MTGIFPSNFNHGHGGILVWMWGLGTHMIGLCHLWDSLIGDDGVRAIWQDIFFLLISKIGYANGLANFYSIEVHLQEMIHSSRVGSFRHYN